MHRTQISIEDEHYAYLVREARSAGVSIAGLLRQMIVERMQGQTEASDPLDALAGIAEGDGTTVGREHDRYLYGSRKA